MTDRDRSGRFGAVGGPAVAVPRQAAAGSAAPSTRTSNRPSTLISTPTPPPVVRASSSKAAPSACRRRRGPGPARRSPPSVDRMAVGTGQRAVGAAPFGGADPGEGHRHARRRRLTQHNPPPDPTQPTTRPRRARVRPCREPGRTPSACDTRPAVPGWDSRSRSRVGIRPGHRVILEAAIARTTTAGSVGTAVLLVLSVPACPVRHAGTDTFLRRPATTGVMTLQYLGRSQLRRSPGRDGNRSVDGDRRGGTGNILLNGSRHLAASDWRSDRLVSSCTHTFEPVATPPGRRGAAPGKRFPWDVRNRM
jgi:hypothetical protein